MQLPKRSDYNYMIHMYYCTAYNHIRYPIHENYLRDSDTYVSSSSLPENIRSRTRGTAHMIVGFSTPISSTSSLTSCDKEVNSQDRPKSKITKRYSGEHSVMLTPRQNPIEAPWKINSSSTTRSKMCARGR